MYIKGSIPSPFKDYEHMLVGSRLANMVVAAVSMSMPAVPVPVPVLAQDTVETAQPRIWKPSRYRTEPSHSLALGRGVGNNPRFHYYHPA